MREMPKRIGPAGPARRIALPRTPIDADGIAHGCPAIDAERIAELERALGAGKLRALLALLDRELADRPLLIRRRLDEGNDPALRSEVHNFRGTVASFGLDAVAFAARAVEIALPGAEIQFALARLEAEADRASASLQPYLRPRPQRRPRSS